MKRCLHLSLLALAPVAVFLAVFGWLTWRQYERVRLRGPLIAAVKVINHFGDEVLKVYDLAKHV